MPVSPELIKNESETEGNAVSLPTSTSRWRLDTTETQTNLLCATYIAISLASAKPQILSSAFMLFHDTVI